MDLRNPQIFGKSPMNIDQSDFIEIFIVKNHFEGISNFVENSRNKERSLNVKGIQCIAGTLGCQRKIYFPLLSEHAAKTIFSQPSLQLGVAMCLNFSQWNRSRMWCVPSTPSHQFSPCVLFLQDLFLFLLLEQWSKSHVEDNRAARIFEFWMTVCKQSPQS